MTETIQRFLYVHQSGPSLIGTPLLNKGSAFTHDERIVFNLIGLLPQNVETIEEQAQRAYQQYLQCQTDLDRHIYLRAVQDDNETLFFRLLEEHLESMLPSIYTPTVGEACQEFSNIYRNHRGLFISYPDHYNMDDMLRSVTKDKVKVIVVTDGERILGLGDQGIGGMGIPIGKLSLYTACGGISPAYTLPITLDVGTNNQALLDDPMYMGWRHNRVSQDDYDAFIGEFITAVKRRWPNVLLHFEDFAQNNAIPLLERYRDELCCYNDDIQGTAAVAVGTLLAGCKAKNESISEQVVAFVGAGSAGCGIAEQVVAAMMEEGLTEQAARARIFMVDRYGLLTTDVDGLYDFQKRLAHDLEDLMDWDGTNLIEVVKNAKPTILIGVSGQPGLFSREIIETMHTGCELPLIMPLSNPTSRAEALPVDILTWTHCKALVATGSPFPPVELNGKTYPIAQCNNAYIFPGIGLGITAGGATRVTDSKIMAASHALAKQAPIMVTGKGALLPALEDIRIISRNIAFAVAIQAQIDEVAPIIDSASLSDAIDRVVWYPRYRTYRRRAI